MSAFLYMKKKTEMGAVGSFEVLSYVTKSGTIVILIASMSGFFERNIWVPLAYRILG